jgi:hypothetical protein
MALVALYFLPTFIGFRKANAGAIFALNLLLGWTLLGWVGALVWALTKEGGPGATILPSLGPVTPASSACPACQASVARGSAFCTICGAKMPARN